MTDSLFLNKAAASILLSGIAFMMAGFVAKGLVTTKELKHTAIKIDVPTQSTAAPAAKPAALPPIAPLLVKADPSQGEAFMNKVCVACHTWNKGGPAKVGPNLYGIVGAPHAHMAGFDYSAGLKAIKGPWTYAELNQWLSNPRSVVEGTRMSYAGIDSAKTRADVIAYLRTLSPNPEPLPKG